MSKVRLKYAALVDALRGTGLGAGDTVMVQSSLLHIGPVEGVATRDGLGEFYYSALREAVGLQGTVLVHTPFEAYGRYREPYDALTSISTGGLLSEYVLALPGAVRSSHPIVSVAGVGPRAQEICGDPHFSGFGWDSPWGRMHRMDIRFLCLGLGLAKGLSFLHYIEAMYGVPYQYIKLYDVPVRRGGIEIGGRFTMSVRYLDFSIQYDYRRFEEHMFRRGWATEQLFERGLLLHATTASKAFASGMECLNRDRFCFLTEAPRFRSGEIPMDGATGDMKIVYHAPRNNG